MGHTNTAGQEGGAGVEEQVSAAQWTAGLMFHCCCQREPGQNWSNLGQEQPCFLWLGVARWDGGSCEGCLASKT